MYSLYTYCGLGERRVAVHTFVLVTRLATRLATRANAALKIMFVAKNVVPSQIINYLTFILILGLRLLV